MVGRRIILGLVAFTSLGLADCSSTPNAMSVCHDYVYGSQAYIKALNAYDGATGRYQYDSTTTPCPSNLTLGTFPGYDCKDSATPPSVLATERQAMARTKAELTQATSVWHTEQSAFKESGVPFRTCERLFHLR